MLQYKTAGFVHRMTDAEYKAWVERGQIPAWLDAEREARKRARRLESERIWSDAA